MLADYTAPDNTPHALSSLHSRPRPWLASPLPSRHELATTRVPPDAPATEAHARLLRSDHPTPTADPVAPAKQQPS